MYITSLMPHASLVWCNVKHLSPTIAKIIWSPKLIPPYENHSNLPNQSCLSSIFMVMWKSMYWALWKISIAIIQVTNPPFIMFFLMFLFYYIGQVLLVLPMLLHAIDLCIMSFPFIVATQGILSSNISSHFVNSFHQIFRLKFLNMIFFLGCIHNKSLIRTPNFKLILLEVSCHQIH